MLLLVLALVWVAILLPILIRYSRDRGGERKIESYHTEREILNRQEHAAVTDAYREYPPPAPAIERERPGRPHLTVVYPDDTVRSLQARGSWEDWRRDYDYDVREGRDAVRAQLEKNRYAAAYASAPKDFLVDDDEPYGSLVAMQMRRRRILITLVLTCLAFTAFTLVSSSLLVEDLAVLSWAALIGFVVLGLVAIGLGYMESPFAPSYGVRPVLETPYRPAYGRDVEDREEEYFEENDERTWRRETAPRRALG